MTDTTTTTHPIELQTTTTPQHTVIVLHGLGADGSDFVPVVPELRLPASLGVRFIFPHAPIIPITINNGYEMRAWYNITSLVSHGEIDEMGIVESIASVEKVIAKEIARGIASENIILAGFSQGAVMALRTGLQYSKPLAGIIALSGYLPLPMPLPYATAALKRPPIFLAHGTEDTVVPYALGKAAYMTLQKAGYTIDWHAYPVPHSICAAEINDISQWIQKIFSQK